MNKKKTPVKIQSSSDNHFHSLKLLAPLVLLILFIFIALVYRPTITGMTVGSLEGHEKLLNLRFTENSNMNFALEKIPVSLKLTGSSTGSARVYLVDGDEKILIINTASIEPDLDGVKYFENYCVDTCEIEMLTNEVRLAIEVDNGELLLEKMLYSSLKDQYNAVPQWEGRTTFLIEGVATEEIVLSNYYADADENDELIFFTKTIEVPFDVSLSGDVLRLTTNTKSAGDHQLSVFASDGKEVVETVLDIVVYGFEEETVVEQAEPIVTEFVIDETYGEQTSVSGSFCKLSYEDDTAYNIGDMPYYDASFVYLNNDIPIEDGVCDISFDPHNQEAYGPAESMVYNPATGKFEFNTKSFDTSTIVGYKISCTGKDAYGAEETLQLTGKTYFFNSFSECRAFEAGDSGRNYVLTKDLVVEDSVCLGFAGVEDVMLDCAGHEIEGDGEGNAIVIFGSSGVTIRNCKTDNFGSAVSASSNGIVIQDNVFSDCNEDAISMKSAEDALIIGNTIKDSRSDAIDLAIVKNSIIVNNIIDTTSGQGSQGITLTEGSANNLIKSNNFVNIADDAVRISNSNAIIVKENQFSALKSRGITTPILCGGSGCTGIQVVGNVFDDISKDAIYLLSVSGSQVDDNVINNQHGDGTNWGILLSASDDVSVNNNVMQFIDNGIGLATTTNSIVENNRIEQSATGAGVSLTADASGNTVKGNLLLNLADGLFVMESHDNTVTENHAKECNIGFVIDEKSANNLYVSNRVELGLGDGVVIGNAGEDVNVANVFTDNSVVSNAGHGFVVMASGSEFTGNTVFDNALNGIYLMGCADNKLEMNSIVSNKASGIDITNGYSNVLSSNSIMSNPIGARLYASENNLLSDNDLEENKYGVIVFSAANNEIIDNSFTNSLETGVHLMTGAEFNDVIENEFEGNVNAIVIDNADMNRISANIMKDNERAVWVKLGEDNEITDNKVANNDNEILVEQLGTDNVINSND